MGFGSVAMQALLVGCGESLILIIILRLISRDDPLSLLASFRERLARPSKAPRLVALLCWSSTVSLACFVQLEQRQRREKQQRQRKQ